MSAKPRPRSPSRLGQSGAELVAGRLRDGGEAPVLGDLGRTGRVDPEVGLGVSDVDDEQHRETLIATARRPRGRPGLDRAPPDARGATVPSGSVRPGSSSSSGMSTKRRLDTSACGRVSRADVYCVSPSSSRSTSITRGPWRGTAGDAGRRPRSVALQASQQLLGTEIGRDRHARVEEFGLVEHEADRLGLIRVRRLKDGHAVISQPADGGEQVRPPVADVGPQAQVGPMAHASGSASRQTSTETSVTGSANGGSGLAAFTHTARASNCDSNRSATAVHSRSRVR